MKGGLCTLIDYDSILSEKVTELKPSGIRKFFDLASEVEDVISLSVGEHPGTSAKPALLPLNRGAHTIPQMPDFQSFVKKFQNI